MRKTMLKRVLAMLCICGLVTGTAGCAGTSGKDVGTERESETPAPEPSAQAADLNEDENSNLGAWARAMGSVLIFLNDGSPYYFGGYKATEDNRDAAVSILASSWSIESRENLLEQIQWLISEGDRKSYLKEAREMAALSKKQLKTAMKQFSGDMLVHYQMLQYNWETWRGRGLLAWDMCRVSHLVQWGYVAGYLDREEAQALIEPAAIKLQKKFVSWEEVQNNWLDGFCLFACVDRDASNTDYTNRKALYERLVGEQNEGRLLYDDSLFGEEIVPISDVSYQAILDTVKKDTAKTDADQKESTGDKKK